MLVSQSTAAVDAFYDEDGDLQVLMGLKCIFSLEKNGI